MSSVKSLGYFIDALYFLNQLYLLIKKGLIEFLLAVIPISSIKRRSQF